MNSKKVIYEDLKNVAKNKWILFIGKTTLEHKIFITFYK